MINSIRYFFLPRYQKIRSIHVYKCFALASADFVMNKNTVEKLSSISAKYHVPKWQVKYLTNNPEKAYFDLRELWARLPLEVSRYADDYFDVVCADGRLTSNERIVLVALLNDLGFSDKHINETLNYTI